jgi:hypothetical protein
LSVGALENQVKRDRSTVSHHGDRRRSPVASDGCGNDFALSFGHLVPSGEAPVVFFDMIESQAEPVETVAESYAAFIVSHMRRQCERLGCGVLSSSATAREGGIDMWP